MKVVVVGGGLSGLAAAYRIRERAIALRVPLELTAFEADSRLGGTIQTFEEDGFLVESGPNGFLDSKPEAVKLAHDLGLGDRLLPASAEAAKRWIVLNGRLETLPDKPKAFLKSRILSLGGKFRIACEPLIRARRDGVDESVASFARRRLGRQAAERLVDPFVSGIFAGDPERLSVGSAFPRLVELEQTFGSLIRASRSIARERRLLKAPATETAPTAGPAGRLTSFPLGMQELIHALGTALSGVVRLGERVTYLRRTPDGWVVGTDPDTAITGVDAVVLALPSFASARLVGPLSQDLVAPLAAIPYAPVSVVALGYQRRDVPHPLDGFGFLAPGSEHRRILGCLFDSVVYPGRSPEGHVLMRAMVGGARQAALALLDEAELVATVRAELNDLIGISADPVYTRVVRWTSAIPQYDVGHREKVAALQAALVDWPGLVVAGNALHGVAVGDCAREAERIAARVVVEAVSGQPQRRRGP